MAAVTSRTANCSVCNQSAPRPLLICFDCSEGTDPDGNVDLTIYCGTDCRYSDKTHRNTCKLKNDRKCLYRAGDLLHAVFYDWRETGFDIEVERTWKVRTWNQADVLCFKVLEDEKAVPAQFPFPTEMFKNEQDKQKMLAFSACTDVMVNLLALNKRALKEITTASHELTLTMDPDNLTIYRWFKAGMDTAYYPHQVLHAVLRGGEEYVLDIAGAQYSQFRAVLPYAEYLPSCAIREMKREELGHKAAEYASAKSNEARPAGYKASVEMQTRFKAAIDDWEASRSQTVHQLLSGNKRNYEEGKDDLLSKIHTALRKSVDDMKSR